MIGSISKIRPCGHHHYYKYAHVDNSSGKVAGNTSNSLYFIEREYVKDIYNDNCWGPFSLYNAKSITNYAFQDGRFTKFKAHTPNLSSAQWMFTADVSDPSPQVEEIEMDYDNLNNCRCLFYRFKLKKLPDNFNPITKSFIHLMTNGCANSISNANNGTFPFYEILNEAEVLQNTFCRNVIYKMDDRYTFKNVTNASGMFYGNSYYSTLRSPIKNLSFKNLINGSNCFFCSPDDTASYNGKFTYFQTTDTMSKLTNGESMFYGRALLSSLYPDYESFSLPSLTNGHNMFHHCILDKPSIIKLSNALPNWSSDTATHKITIGCHIDHKYDPDVNVALKKLDSNYTTPIEEYGSSLPTTISSFKGWTLTVQWNGTKTANAYPEPS